MLNIILVYPQTSAYDVFDVTPNVTPVPPNLYENDQISLAKNSLQLHGLWMRMNESQDRIEFRDHRFRFVKHSRRRAKQFFFGGGEAQRICPNVQS